MDKYFINLLHYGREGTSLVCLSFIQCHWCHLSILTSSSPTPLSSVWDLISSCRPSAENQYGCFLWITHADAAHGDDGEGAQDSRCAHDPGETQEEDHTQDVLHAGQVDADESSHLGHLGGWGGGLKRDTHIYINTYIQVSRRWGSTGETDETVKTQPSCDLWSPSCTKS